MTKKQIAGLKAVKLVKGRNCDSCGKSVLHLQCGACISKIVSNLEAEKRLFVLNDYFKDKVLALFDKEKPEKKTKR